MSNSMTSSAGFDHGFVTCAANSTKLDASAVFVPSGNDWTPSLIRSAEPMSVPETGELPPHENQSATPSPPPGFLRTTCESVAPPLSAACEMPWIATFETCVGDTKYGTLRPIPWFVPLIGWKWIRPAA